MNNSSFDSYLADGCGRCEHYQKPSCKVHHWTEPLQALRALVLAHGLVEEMKWGSPCYTLQGKNVLMLSAFREHCALQFFKGAVLHDPEGRLLRPGPNSHIARYLKFQSAQEVREQEVYLNQLIEQAIALERAGTKPIARTEPEPLPVELASRLEADPVLQQAFDALTPGRQRSHILHISGAKQHETRERRTERCIPEILAGRGFHER